jgi:hypothetical protein
VDVFPPLLLVRDIGFESVGAAALEVHEGAVFGDDFGVWVGGVGRANWDEVLGVYYLAPLLEEAVGSSAT